MADKIKQIKIGTTTYDITAIDSDKLGGQEASKYALIDDLPAPLVVKSKLTEDGVVVWETVTVTEALNTGV